MNLFTRIAKWWSGNATGQHSGSQLTQPATSAHDDTPIIGVDSALQVSTVWACVSILTDVVSSLPLMVWRDDKGARVSAKGTTLYEVLHDSPNRRHTAQEFWEFMMLNFVLRGNAYARVDRNGAGEVVALWPLSADQMEVIASDDGSLMYIYYLGNEGIVYQEQNILHIRGKGNGVVGMSPLDYMRSSVSLAIKAQNHTVKTYTKNARRPGLLMVDGVLTPEQRAAVKNNFGDIVTGSDKELYVLEAKFKFEALGMSPADMQLLESRKFSVEDLARWLGVPSVLINDSKDSSALGSSTKEVIDAFVKLRLRSILVKTEQAIRKRVFTPRQRAQGYVAEFKLDALLRASLSERMDAAAKGVQNGLLTRNEGRALENRPAMDGGDILTAQTNLAPLDMLGRIQSGKAVPEQPIQQ